MLHVVSFSSGLSSALAVERVLDRYGPIPTIVVFEDTTFEDEDNYRFLGECQLRWGVPIIELCDGRTPYEVAEKEQIIPNQKFAPCTRALKIKPFVKFLKTSFKLSKITIHIGYDFTELERCEDTTKAYAKFGWSVDFPLLWKPIEYRPYTQVVREDWHIEPPRMYAMGYTRANCGGECCKQGQGDWLRTLLNFPKRFAERERWEQEHRQKPGRENYAILRIQREGVTYPLTLKELRERYEGVQITQPVLFKLDCASTCIHCGVGSL